LFIFLVSFAALVLTVIGQTIVLFVGSSSTKHCKGKLQKWKKWMPVVSWCRHCTQQI